MSSDSQVSRHVQSHVHTLKNVALIVLSLALLPLNTAIILAVSLANSFLDTDEATVRRNAIREDSNFSPRTILVTGVGMTKGLTLARTFYEAGHNVIGADFESNHALVSGRVSKSLSRFYPLTAPFSDSLAGSSPYTESLLSIVVQEKVDLWVSCSGVASALSDAHAKEAIEGRTSCLAIQFDLATTQTLHEKHLFISHTRELGLSVPETHTTISVSEAVMALENAPDSRRFIMKPIGVDDANRGDLTLLPKSSPRETHAHLSRLNISDKSPWILQQFIQGPEYCTHALVIQGEVKAFVACPSAELLMHYEALPRDSKLSRAMESFTREFAAKGGRGFTGHLSFDFMVEESQMSELGVSHVVKEGGKVILYPIECNPRAHTAVVLFRGEALRLADAYLSLVNEEDEELRFPRTVVPQSDQKYYWVGHDLVELLVLPFVLFVFGRRELGQLLRGLIVFTDHALHWSDGTFEWWDPWPLWWLYHVYWPAKFLHCLRTGAKWSRINVSTTKIFIV